MQECRTNIFSSKRSYIKLTFSDVLSTMSRESYLARRVLFETARLQRPLLSVGSLKLSGNARVVDEELIKLEKVLHNGDELIRGGYKNHDRILEGEPFKKALRMYFFLSTLLSQYHVFIPSWSEGR